MSRRPFFFLAGALVLAACGKGGTSKPEGATTTASDGAAGGGAAGDGAVSSAGDVPVDVSMNVATDAAGEARDDVAGDAERAAVATLEPTLTGGTRLRPRVWLTSDGDALPILTTSYAVESPSPVLGPWFDTLLGVDCLFGVAEDGALRCLPVDFESMQGLYLDPACTMVGYEYPENAQPRYHTSDLGSAFCVEQQHRVRRIVEPVATPATTYITNAAACETFGPVADPGTHWFRAELVPPTSFVAAKTTVAPGAGGLSVVTLVADDGAVERRALSDTARKAACAPTYLNTEFRCLPDVVQSYPQVLYADGACTLPSTVQELCAMTSHVWSNLPLPSVFGSCGLASNVLVFKDFDPAATAFQSTNGSCAPAVLPAATLSLFQQGAQIPVTNFPVVETVERGRGRLKVPYSGPAGGPALVTSGQTYTDSTLAAECVIVTVAGRTVCRPSASVGLERFSDPACTVPVYEPPDMADCTKPAPGAVVLGSTGLPFSVTTRTFTGPIYLVGGTPVGCHVSGSAKGFPWVALDPIPLDQLVGVRAGVE